VDDLYANTRANGFRSSHMPFSAAGDRRTVVQVATRAGSFGSTQARLRPAARGNSRTAAASLKSEQRGGLHTPAAVGDD
jgi:hypothetical protein